jgi:hypothetical protein
MKSFTKASLKKILREKTCYIKQESDYSWYSELAEKCSWDFKLIEKVDFSSSHDFWIKGLWLTGRDFFNLCVVPNTVNISNCCGSCVIKWLD